MRGQTAHVDAAAVAEFRVGLVAGRRGTRIAAHLACCARCAALAALLADVSALLAAVPVPAVPDAVARRLDSVLAAEAAGRNDPERAGGGAPRERRAAPGRPGRARGGGFRPVTVRVLAPAAAVAVLGGAGYGISLLAGGQSASTAASAAAAASPAQQGAKSAVGGPMLPGTGPDSARHRAALGFSVVASGTDYLPGTARRQLRDALRDALSARVAQGASRPATTEVKACIDRVTNGTGQVIRVETARYQGRPATVIFARAGGGYQAWVAGPACSSVVYHMTLP